MTDAEQSSPPISPADTTRAADTGREAIAETLRIATAEGRIDFEELDDRLGHAYSARTYEQLRALISMSRRLPLSSDAFGTRHRSMMRYCNSNPGSVGFVISEDGDIRAMTKVGQDLVVWDGVLLQRELSSHALNSAGDRTA